MSREFTLNHITKIEGHAKLYLSIDDGQVTRCELAATEGARYFEGLVVGRKYFEAHEITSRICGICSSGHVVAAVTAIEDAIGFIPSAQTIALRVLMTLAERIRSHATHLYFLCLPDYLGYESALSMISAYKAQLHDALALMKVGNSIVRRLGARDLHPVSAAVGGWLKLPTQEDLGVVREDLLSAREAAIRTCTLFTGLDFPEFTSEGEGFALVHSNEYAVLEGYFTGPATRIAKKGYRDFIREYHEPYSTSNFVLADDHRYWVSALARINHSHTRLTDEAGGFLRNSGVPLPSRNPHHNTVAQAVELLHCLDHSIQLCEELIIREEPYTLPPPRAGTGVGAIEVPRGTLWHEYTLDDEGTILSANVITPTAQNLLNMQEDIRALVPAILDKTHSEIVTDIEKLIRSFDPCFSCSAHFLEVEWR